MKRGPPPPYAFGAAITIAALLFAAQIAQAWFGQPAFRKQTVQAIIDDLAVELPGKGRKNRITIFRRVKGWRAFLIGSMRLLRPPWHPSKRAKFRALRRLLRHPFSDFLFPYLRSSEGRSSVCVATFRVDDREEECECMAGRAWIDGFFALPNLRRLRKSQRDQIPELTIETILGRPPQDTIRRYVEDSWIRNTEQLHSFETFARHFMGHEIDTGMRRPWGVILLDSDEEECPFDAASPTGGTFGEVFRTHATSLGHILR